MNMSVTVRTLLEKSQRDLTLALKHNPADRVAAQKAWAALQEAIDHEPASRPPIMVRQIGDKPDLNSGLIHMPPARRNYPHARD